MERIVGVISLAILLEQQCGYGQGYSVSLVIRKVNLKFPIGWQG